VLLQFSLIPAFEQVPLEVSDVRPNSQSSSVRVERRVVLRQKHQFNLAGWQFASAILGARSASKEFGEGSDEDGCSKENVIPLPRMQS
jgi:hypothetical protein